MESTCNTSEKKRWIKEAVHSLIEAYKQEKCLYAINKPNYYNKQMRSKALQKVREAVSLFRPGTTENECSVKFSICRTNTTSKKQK